ncbi:MAG: CRTAC1 family protein, partial [Acidobacteriota bacterium]
MKRGRLARLRLGRLSFARLSLARWVMVLLISALTLAMTSPGAFGASVTFVNVTDAAGLTHSHQTTQTILRTEDICDCMDVTPVMGYHAEILVSWITGGVAAGDYDGDGWIDLYVIGGDAGSNRLFRNLGDKTFEDVTAATGVGVDGERTAGAVFVDFDGDGDLDLFVGGALDTPPRLFRAEVQIDDTVLYTDVWSQAFADFDTAKTPVTWSPAFADYDGDGDLDAFLPHSMSPHGPILDPQTMGSTQHLWRNEGDGTFRDVSIETGISALFGVAGGPGESERDQTFSPNFVDLDEDGRLDLVIAGDVGTSRVLLNRGDGTFANATDGAVITGRTAMGTTVGDFDNDSHFDWFVSHVRFIDPASGNRLYRGLGDGTLENVTASAGVRNGHWGWGACAADFDNDGHLDLFHVNGFYHVPNNPFVFGGEWTNTPAVLFRSNGDGTFTQRAAEMGLSDGGEGRGVSCLDYDRDGDIDVAISNHRGPFRLWENVGGHAAGFVRLRLAGRAPNTRAIGARVELRPTGAGSSLAPQLRLVRAGSNFVSSDPAELLFGLAGEAGPLELEVSWPDGSISQSPDIAPSDELEIPQSLLAVTGATTFPEGAGGMLEGRAEDLSGQDLSDQLQWAKDSVDNVVGTGPTLDLASFGLEVGSHA